MFGWAHNSHFLRYVENAEHELLSQLGVSPVADGVGWPRVNFTIDFRSPLAYADPYQVQLQLLRLGSTSLTWGFQLHSGDTLIAEGRMTSVQVGPDKRPLVISEDLRSALGTVF